VDLRNLSVAELLERLAATRPAPGGGSAAAIAVASAAALLAMAARCSGETWEDAAGVAAQAKTLRSRVLELAEEDADVYERALETLAAPQGETQDDRDAAIAAAVAHAAEVPLAIARAGADVAGLARLVADRCEPRAAADAVCAVYLAEAGARAAANLVAVNLTARPDDSLVTRARAAADEAETARRALVFAGGPLN
jgi:formiminotetrahydrofolate cyclodeaminase